MVSELSAGIIYEHQMDLRSASVYSSRELFSLEIILQAVKLSRVLRDEAVGKTFSFKPQVPRPGH